MISSTRCLGYIIKRKVYYPSTTVSSRMLHNSGSLFVAIDKKDSGQLPSVTGKVAQPVPVSTPPQSVPSTNHQDESDIAPFFTSPLNSMANSFRDPFFGSIPLFSGFEPTLVNFAHELSKPVRIDVSEDPQQYTVLLSLPGGARKDDLHVKVEPNHMLHMWGQTTHKSSHRQQTVSFERWSQLPNSVDGSRLTAKFDNGKLTVNIPKSEQAKADEKKGEINIQ